MISASPLVKNDPRLSALVECLKLSVSLEKVARTLGYESEKILRERLRDLLGEEVFKAALQKRPR
jgi:hypothetical protein